jgi:four helix bundle protein
MSAARSFRELKVYALARESARLVFERTRTFPKEERYALVDQIRRSSRAINAMLAEAWARRRYKASFINKIDEALGEANETQSWLDDALDCGYLTATEFKDLDQCYQNIGGMLSRMIDRADDFCKHAPATDYREITGRVSEDPPFTDTTASQVAPEDTARVEEDSPFTDH